MKYKTEGERVLLWAPDEALIFKNAIHIKSINIKKQLMDKQKLREFNLGKITNSRQYLSR